MIYYLIILGIIVATSLIAASPAYAEVRTFSIEKSTYTNEELLTFVGVEETGKKSVFVVIRGPGGNYVGMFSDPASDSDGSFSTIPRSVEDFFKSQGIYTATAFTDDQNEKNGKTIQLDYDGKKLSVNDDFESTQPKISIFAKTELPSYENGNRVVVTGSITNFDYSTHSDIALSYRVLDTTGNIVTLGQTLPNPKGVFSFDFVAGGSLFKLSGDYPIQLIFGSVNDEISMTYTGGEFQSALPPGPSSTLPPTFNPPRSSNAIIITIEGDSVFYLDSPSAIIRGNVEILDFSPSDGLYFMKVTHVPTQKVLKDFEIYPRYSGNDLWSVQIAYPILETDIQFGGQTLYGEFEVEVTSENGGQTGRTSFFIFESQDNDKSSIPKVPEWIKNNAKWWADGLIDDKTFVSGIQFLIKERILNVSITQSTTSSTNSQVPEWIKTNADWWARGLITEDDFLKGIEYLRILSLIKN